MGNFMVSGSDGHHAGGAAGSTSVVGANCLHISERRFYGFVAFLFFPKHNKISQFRGLESLARAPGRFKIKSNK
jgi:hypothetical protein